MIRSIIFDLDPTLVDSSAICAKIPSDMLRYRGDIGTGTADVAISFHGIGGPYGHAGVGGDRSRLSQFHQFADLPAPILIARRTCRARRCAA